MHGLVGELEIYCLDAGRETLLRLLSLGETCSFGADIAFGCGCHNWLAAERAAQLRLAMAARPDCTALPRRDSGRDSNRDAN